MTQNGFMFVVSKEKNDDGSYETGFRIQGIMKVRERSGLSASKASIHAQDKFEKAAKRVVGKCAKEQAGPFQRLCLETIHENPKNPKDSFHVVYSIFWNDELDMMVTTIFGAPESTWPEARKIHRVLKDFTLLDTKKWSAIDE